ncbi:MAG: Fe(3+) ABC transporter substrate-binding protein [Litorimonas sp.]
MRFKTFLALSAASLLAACAPGATQTDAVETAAIDQSVGVVNLYSSRHYDTDLALYEEFTDQTGIEVNRIEANANALIERIASEGEFSPADLLITVDAGVLWRADEQGLLAPVDSDVLEARVPDYLRHPDGHWFGLSKRARVIVYNKDQGLPEGLDSYADLADPALRGTVCIRSSGNIYNISLLSALIAQDGAEAAEEWAEGVVANFARRPQSNDTGQIEAVASGECGVALVNSYYLARLARSDDPDRRAIYDAVGVIFPDQDGRGTHVNISGAGVVATAPNRDNAVRFLEYLTSPAAQAYFADGNNEYPVIDDADASAALDVLGAFEEDQISVATFGPNQAEAIAVFDRAGWQ